MENLCLWIIGQGILFWFDSLHGIGDGQLGATYKAPLSVVAYGIAARVAKEAINILREEGYKVGMIRPITLYPFPKASLDNLDYSKVKGIIDVEMTIPAQMRDDIELQVKGRCPVYEYGRSGGILLDDEGVYNAIAEIVKGGQN